jgi:hypothetical protein
MVAFRKMFPCDRLVTITVTSVTPAVYRQMYFLASAAPPVTCQKIYSPSLDM